MLQMWSQANVYARFMIVLLVTAPISMILLLSLVAKVIRKAQIGGNRVRA